MGNAQKKSLKILTETATIHDKSTVLAFTFPLAFIFAAEVVPVSSTSGIMELSTHLAFFFEIISHCMVCTICVTVG